jgi:hypothetical protein
MSDANERVPCGALPTTNDLAQIPQPAARDALQLWQQRFADDDHPGAAVVQDVLVVGRLPQRVGRHRDGADLDRAKKRVDELRAVEQQQQDALLDAHVEHVAQGVAESIDVVEHLTIRDPLGPKLDGDVAAASFGDVAIDEPCRDVEVPRNGSG